MGERMLVVSGCPRSGTSLCMEIQRVVHNNILGAKFPQERPSKPPRKLRDIYKYIDKKFPKANDDCKDMNPDGFWEMEFTCSGIRYLYHMRNKLSGDYTVKVVSQGLIQSNPKYIDRIIYMVRHPRAVAKSQERLKRQLGNPVVDGVEQMFHTPEMFIEVTAEAALFFITYPEIPVLFVDYEELVRDPDKVLHCMEEFVGGDYSKAKGVVKQKLNRSKHSDIDHPLWEDAEKVYDLLKKKDFEALIKYIKNPKIQYNRWRSNWNCLRAKQAVNDIICKRCKTGIGIKDMKKHSESIEGQYTLHWSKEPCLYECGFNVDDKPISVEESIKNNDWL